MSVRRVASRALPILLLVAVLPATATWAQEPSQQLLVLDQDAHSVSEMVAGALYNRRLDAPGGATSAPELEIAADTGAGNFEFISGLAVSPVDGSVWISDLGQEYGAADDGAIFRHVADSGAVTTISDRGTSQLRDPFSLAFAPDGRLFVVDWEADPSGFGADMVGGAGHGAVFEVDTTSGAMTLVSDGTNHDLDGLSPTQPAFQDPIGIAWDPVRELLYVADFSADGDEDSLFNGTVFSLDVATGELKVVSAYWNFVAPTGVAVRTDGTPLVLDAVRDDSFVFEIDLSAPDLFDNVSYLTSGTQYALLEGVAVDQADRVFVVDIGEYDETAGEFVVLPGAYRVDESQRSSNPDFDLDNKIPVVLWADGVDTILSPVNLAPVPVPVVDRVLPRSVTEPTVVTIEGRNLLPELDFDFGGSVTVSDVSFAPGRELGTALTLTLTPVGGMECSPSLFAQHPFGGGIELTNAVSLVSEPAPPFSVFGDANRDGIVDGLDLGILGRSFGASVCETGLFSNDADFNNDDLISGLDLTILMTYFGARP